MTVVAEYHTINFEFGNLPADVEAKIIAKCTAVASAFGVGCKITPTTPQHTGVAIFSGNDRRIVGDAVYKVWVYAGRFTVVNTLRSGTRAYSVK